MEGDGLVQGESDSNAQNAPLYKDRLTTLIANVRTYIGVPDLPVVISQTQVAKEGFDSVSIAQIQKAQAEVAKEDEMISLVETADQIINQKEDGLHFHAEAHVVNGYRSAQELIALNQQRESSYPVINNILKKRIF